MKKIGIATLYTGFNYGSALQAYAVKAIVERLDCSGDIFKMKGSLIKGRDVRVNKLFVMLFRAAFNAKGRKSLKNFKTSISKPLSDETMRLFSDFIDKKIKPIEISYSKLKKKAHSEEYDAFLCGSDQIWGSTELYIDPFYYLQFAPQNKRIAFSPSFGKDFVPDYNKKRIAKYLSEIKYKSVREQSGVGIVKELTGDNAEVLIDPTLVLTSDDWRGELELQADHKTPYLLAYFLDTPSELAFQTIKELSDKYSLKIVGLPYQTNDLPWESLSAGPKEFVELISNAKVVCTDSFHGTAFSLNFNVPFYTFERNYGDAEKQSTRIHSILNYVGLTERLDPSSSDTCFDIDFDEVNEKLNEERKHSYQYLADILLEL